MRVFRLPILVPLVFLGGSLQAQTVINLSKSGSDVVINISGTPTFSVYRSSRPDFAFDGATLNDALGAASYTDAGALQSSTVLYCYDVAAVGEASPGRVAGGSPQPNLQITLLSPNAGKEGDAVTISGTGFGQFFPENLVTFNGKPAIVTGTGAGTLAVTVPVGATAGPVQVRVGRLSSNTLPFAVSPVGAFSNLSGIGVNPGNSHVFVTDTGAAASSSLIELDPFAGWTKTTRGGTGNIRGFPFSPLNNRFFYSNASRSDFNAGNIFYWDVGTLTQTAWPINGGTATSDPVSCVAMGASPVNTTFVFFADRRHQEIRRIGDFTGRTVYASGFAFPDSDYNPVNVAGFAGLAFDNNGVNGTTDFGDLYVGDSTNVEKVVQTNPIIAPDTTTTTQVLTGLVSVAGVTFDTMGTSEYQTRTLHIADRGGNALWLHSAVSGTAEQRLTGLNQPRMASLGQTNDTPPETRLYIAEPTRVVATDDLRVDMTPKEDIRALISNCPSGNNTPGCVGAAFPSSFQNIPRQIAIAARVHPARAGVTIWFDVEDPPDTAPYEVGSPPGDNITGESGSLPGPSAVTNAAGVATTVLTVTDRYAGNNYRVRARLASGGPVVAKTGVITAWKRLFVEKDKMFRAAGQYLTANAAAGATVLAVSSTARFSAGDVVDVFDAVNDLPEVRQIAVGGVGPASITLTSALSQSHPTSDSAYVGREVDGFYDADLSYVYAAFDDAFVEVVTRPDGAHPVPYKPESELETEAHQSAFSATWFRNGKVARDGTNYLHVIGCETIISGMPPTNAFFGLSFAPNNWILVAVQRIEAFYPGNPTAIKNAIRGTGEHEVGHHLAQGDHMVGEPGHPAWCNPPGLCPGQLCLMHPDRSRDLGIDEFESIELLDNVTSVRKLVDPV